MRKRWLSISSSFVLLGFLCLSSCKWKQVSEEINRKTAEVQKNLEGEQEKLRKELEELRKKPALQGPKGDPGVPGPKGDPGDPGSGGGGGVVVPPSLPLIEDQSHPVENPEHHENDE